MNDKCYVVIHHNYADGKDACVYREEAEARRSVKEDVETVKSELLKDGYEPMVIWDAFGNPEVIAADGNIYYEWEIVETPIL